MRIFQSISLFFGRILISLIFLLSGFHKILHWQMAQGGLISALQNWIEFLGKDSYIGWIAESAIPYTFPLIVAAIAIEIVGALLLVLSVRIRLGAALLIIFLVPTTMIFHHFWWFTGLKQEMELVMFLKNSAILGGLFYVLAYEPNCNVKSEKINNSSEAD